MREILQLFPNHIQEKLSEKIKERWVYLQEIRLRLNKPIELNFVFDIELIDDIYFTSNDRNFVLNQLSEHSLYRFQTELKEGFITITGGHRVGLAGKVTSSNNNIKGLKFITFFNIRIAQQIKGVAEPLMEYLHDNGTYFDTMIIGAPQSGKTTLLRDLARLMSDGCLNFGQKKVAIIDERSEIAACKQGVPQFDIGSRTDVMDACPKSIGMMMMIRSMSPEVILVDEIGKEKDVQAILDVFHAGVSIVCTVHGSSLSGVKKRLSLQDLFKESIFKRYILLSRSYDKSFVYKIYNERGYLLTNKTVSWR